MNQTIPHLGLGIGWRPELALAIDRHPGLGFVEVMAEDLDPFEPLPASLERLRLRGLPLIPHGVTLSLGGVEEIDGDRVAALGRLATRLGAPLVSEHLSFIRAAGLESGHLLPLPRTREMLEIVIANVRAAQDALPVPLALENVACLFEWPHAEMDEATFLNEVLEGADVLLLLDIENVYANARNHGLDPLAFLDRVPLGRLAYVHVAGGIERQGLYHDTHAHPVPREVLALLEELCARVAVRGVMLERDDRFPDDAEFLDELAAIGHAVARGAARREASHALA
jgi:uncharacterized protein (UPF0276 family)